VPLFAADLLGDRKASALRFAPLVLELKDGEQEEANPAFEIYKCSGHSATTYLSINVNGERKWDRQRWHYNAQEKLLTTWDQSLYARRRQLIR